MTDLDNLRGRVHQAVDLDTLAALTLEALGLLADVEARMASDSQEIEKLLRVVLDYSIETEKLRMLLRQALRAWTYGTRNVEEAIIAWQIAKEAGLA